MEQNKKETFLNGIGINITEKMHEKSACYVGIPFEKTTGKRKGTADAADYIRKESLNFVDSFNYLKDSETYDCMWNEHFKYDGNRIYDVGNICFDEMELMLQNVEHYVGCILKNRCLPIVIGGEHTVTIPSFNAFKKMYNNVAYIHLDSHFDFGNENSDGGKIYRGSVSRRISEMLNNDYGRMFWIGCSDYTKHEQFNFIKKRGGNIFTICDIKTLGIEVITNNVIRLLRQYDNIYLSFDVDVMDSAYMGATSGVPIMGLTPYEVMFIIRKLSTLKIKVWDIVEHSPKLDITNNSTFLLTQMIIKLLLYYFNHASFDE